MYTGSYKLGINLMGGSGLSVDEHVALLKRIGWDGFFTGWNREKLGEFRAAADKHGMIWQSIHAPFTQVRYMWNEGEEKLPVIRDGGSHFISCAMPIISEGDIVGCVASVSDMDSDKPHAAVGGDVEGSLPFLDLYFGYERRRRTGGKRI